MISTRVRPSQLRSDSQGTPHWQSGVFVTLGAALTVVAVAKSDTIGDVLVLLAGFILTAGVVILWRRGRTSGGWAALGLATAGLSVGIGIGLRALNIGVIDLSSIVSVIALVGGLTVMWLAVAKITSALGLGWRVVTDALLIVLVAMTTWTIVPALVATSVPPMAPGDSTPADYGLEAVEVEFDTDDGVHLAAWYVSPPAGKVAIVRHGAGSTASDVLPQAEVLASNGFGVLITDARGHGRSSGEAMDFGWFGDRDIGAAVDFLLSRPEVDPVRIVVVGLSMGGEEAIGAAGSDSRIAAVVAEGSTARTDADKIWLADEYGWRGSAQTWLEWVQYTLTDLLTDASKPTSLASAAAAMAPRQLLLITGGDAPDEANAARHMESSAKGNVTVWTVSGAGHIQGLRVAPDEWEQTVIEFLDQALLDLD